MGHFCLAYRDANRLVGLVIMEASSLPRARMNIAMRSVAVGARFAEGYQLSVRQRELVPASQIGRVLPASRRQNCYVGLRQRRKIIFKNNRRLN
jgi:hypothetical protein